MARLEIIVDSGTAKRNTDDMTKSLNALERAGTQADTAAKKAGQGVSKLGSDAKSGDSGVRGLEKSVGLLKTTLLAAGVAAAGFSVAKLIDSQRDFDKLNAGLVTATGSTEKAALAFETLQKFAATTPYTLEQAVTGFTKLVNLGLTPSEAALNSYGNTAAAMGKDLTQMVEAVADATTGEFERLKEFGIKAKQNGDTVKVTFQGVTTSIGNNAADIENYLIKIGEVNFAGAMEQRAKTLDGAISNLSDTFDNLFLTVSGSGFGDFIKDAVIGATKAIQSMIDMFESGEIPALLEGFGDAFGGMGEDAVNAVKLVLSGFGSLSRSIGLTRDGVIEDLNDMANAWNEFRSLVQKSAVIIAATVETIRSGKSQVDNLSQELDLIDNTNKGRQDSLKIANERSKQLADEAKLLEGINDQVKLQDLAKNTRAKSAPSASSKADDKAAKELEKSKNQFKQLQDLALTETQRTQKELDTRTNLISKFVDKGSAEYTRLTNWANTESKRRIIEDEVNHDEAINQFRDMVGTRIDILTREAVTRTKLAMINPLLSQDQRKEAVAAIGEFYDNKQDLMKLSDRMELSGFQDRNRTELENIRVRYAFEREQILLNKQLTETEKQQRISGLGNQEGGDVKSLQESTTADLFGLQADLSGEAELMALSQQYAKRMEIIDAAVKAEAVTVEKGNELKLLSETDYRNATIQLQMSQAASILDSTTQMFGQMFGEQSNAYKVMFAASKAFSIAQSIVAISTGIALAAANPFPLNLGAIASVIAATASIVSTISSTTMGGYADGGYTGSGGKNDPAGIVHKGEVVWSQDDIRRAGGVSNVEAMRKGFNAENNRAQKMQSSNQTANNQNPIINIHNHGIDEAIEDWFKGSSSDKHFVNKFERNKSSMRMA